MYRLLVLLTFSLALAACQSAATTPPAVSTAPPSPPKNTLIHIQVGDKGDNGWGATHDRDARKVASQRGWAYLAYENLNPGNPNKPVCETVVSTLIGTARKDNPGGRILVRFNSDDFATCAPTVAKQFPGVFFEHISGDHVKQGTAPPNLMNATASNEYPSALLGCVAGVMSRSGKLADLTGPIQAETRRVFNAKAWGAQHCAPDKPIEFLNLSVGFWFHIPGQTNDPRALLGQAHALGVDGFSTGIDTQDSLAFAKSLADKGEYAFGFGWDFSPSCSVAPKQCAGVAYLNWEAELNHAMSGVERGTFKSEFMVFDPDWPKVFTDASPTGFLLGEGITPEAKKAVEAMAADFASGKLKLFAGPLKWEDGTEWVKAGEAPAFWPDVWNSPKLLAGTRMMGGK